MSDTNQYPNSTVKRKIYPTAANCTISSYEAKQKPLKTKDDTNEAGNLFLRTGIDVQYYDFNIEVLATSSGFVVPVGYGLFQLSAPTAANAQPLPEFGGASTINVVVNPDVELVGQAGEASKYKFSAWISTLYPGH